MRHRRGCIPLFLAGFLCLTGTASAQQALVPSQPTVLEFEGTLPGSSIRCVFRLQSIAPDLRAEWEEDFKLGAFTVPARVLESSREFNRRSTLPNGREEVLKAPVLVLGQQVFDELARGDQVPIKIHQVAGWLRKESSTVFEVGDLRLPALVCTDNLGRTYIFQDSREFPLLLEYRNPHYQERLTRVHSGRDVIFRWFKSSPGR